MVVGPIVTPSFGYGQMTVGVGYTLSGSEEEMATNRRYACFHPSFVKRPMSQKSGDFSNPLCRDSKWLSPYLNGLVMPHAGPDSIADAAKSHSLQ